MYKITIVEDDDNIRGELKSFLEKFGYECILVEDFENVLKDIFASDAHLVLLDINLPVYDGFHICREIRKKSNIPVIFITSRTTDVDELMGIHMGADDFVSKPFNTQILLARIESLIKRTYEINKSSFLEYKGIKLDSSQGTVWYKEKAMELTKNENRILKLMMENKSRIISRDEIMDYLWQSNEFIDDNTLTVNINRLRNKLKSIGVVDIIQTKRGQGYILK
jgi:DNA-binding response OmpR family regulator